MSERMRAYERELAYAKNKRDAEIEEAAHILKGSKTHLAHNLSARAVAIGEAQAKVELLEIILRELRAINEAVANG